MQGLRLYRPGAAQYVVVPIVLLDTLVEATHPIRGHGMRRMRRECADSDREDCRAEALISDQSSTLCGR